MNYIKKGFTIVELMIVITLIGLFLVATSYLSNDVRVHQTYAERLANNIYDIIRNARNNMIIGRGVFTGGTLIVTTQRTITIYNTGVLTSYEYGMSNSGTETSFLIPFYDNDFHYNITDIAVSSGGIINGIVPQWDSTGATNADIIIKQNSEIAITAIKGGLSITPIRTLKITAGYGGFEQSVIIDRVTGTVELKKSSED